MASEVAAKVAAHFEGQADIKVRTLGFAEVPCPTAPSLEEDFYPDPIAIASMAHQLVKGTPLKQDPNEIFNWKEIEFKGPF
jgi:pyruvate/2-oxoglutarate/acetoin dehydrogenase E1 component